MSYESSAEPIKIGYLMDFRLPDGYPKEMKEDFSQPFELLCIYRLMPLLL